MAEQVQLLVSKVSPAPLTYTVPGSQEVMPVAAAALFDGSAAGGSWLPALEIVSDAGQVVARCIGSQVADGSSAEVTFAPFLRAGGAAGIQYDVDNQAGGTLWLETTGVGDSFGAMRLFVDDGPFGLFDESATGDGSFQLGKGVMGGGIGGILLSTGADLIKILTGTGALQILAGSGTLTIGENNGNLTIGAGVGYDGADGALLAATLGKILELQHLRHRTTVGAAGAAAALPATPTAYLEIDGLSVPAYDIA